MYRSTYFSSRYSDTYSFIIRAPNTNSDIGTERNMLVKILAL